MNPFEQNVITGEVPEGTRQIWGRFHGEGGWYECDLSEPIEIANIEDHPVTVQVIRPMTLTAQKFPLIVFIQGSAWRPQPIHMAYSKMFKAASMGYVVALVKYRDTDCARFPAPVEDTLTAIRFMRKNADRFGVDKTRVAVWGDSSGGNVALMTGFSAGKYPNGYYEDESDAVGALVDFYGITDIATLGYCNEALDHDAPDAPEALLIGGAVPVNIEKANAASPYHNIPEGVTPPLLIVHGDADGVVSVTQSIKLYKKMRELGKPVQFVKVIHADHGLGIWQQEIFDLVNDFLCNNLWHPSVDSPLFQHEN